MSIAFPATVPERLRRQLAFLIEADRLKQVKRANRIGGGLRRENSAEHSWHLALFALLLAEWSEEPVELAEVLGMTILHDIIEIECGDTPLHSAADRAELARREAAAAERVFGSLPADQAAHFRHLWRCFEQGSTPAARFARALDRLQPVMQNHQSHGGTWMDYAVSETQVKERTAAIGDASSALGAVADAIFAHAVQQGWLQPADGDP